MKTILYMVMTVDGFIAKENDEAPWSDEVWENYKAFAKEVGNIVVGKRTFDILKTENEFEAIGNPTTVVLSSQESEEGFTFVTSPAQALKSLEDQGFETAYVGGGSKTCSAFIQEGLVDEIILDVEPMIFGKGIRLFSDLVLDVDLELVEVSNKAGSNVVQLKYRVK